MNGVVERRLRVAREDGTREGTHFYHIEDGLHYHLNVETEDDRRVMYFKCILYERGCRGRATFNRVDGFRHTNQHNHQPDLNYPEEMELRRNILRRCATLEYRSFQSIIDEEKRGYPVEVRTRLSLAKLRTSMRRVRLNNYPAIPNNLQQLTDILNQRQYEVITMTEDGEDNLYGGSVTDINGGHHILFVSQRMIELMRTLRVFHGDGTFKVVPSGPECDQVFAIVGVWNHAIIPLAWALMENRTEVAYTSLFQLLQQQLGEDIELRKVITDFETGQQNAWQSVFRVRIQGCLWHACRAFLLKIANLALLGHMRRIAEVKRIIRLVMALPLLPAEDIRCGLREIKREARAEGNYIYQLVKPFLKYIKTHWVRKDRRRQRMSVFGSTQRTNNACESHNKNLRLSLGVHPNIYVFIRGLVSLEHKSFDTKTALQAGRRVTRGRKRTSVMNDLNLLQLSEDLMNPPGPRRLAVFNFLRHASNLLNNLVDEALH